MKAERLSVDTILAKYPGQKPMCLNYVEMRGELIALASENLNLTQRLAAFKEGLNPDSAEEFAKVADSLLTKMDVIIDGLDKNNGVQMVSVHEISRFLRDAGHLSASNELDCRYGI